MRVAHAGVFAAVLIVAVAHTASGAELIPGTTCTVRPLDVVRAAHRPESGTFPLPASPADAAIAFFDTATPSAGNVIYSLPIGSWRGLGMPAGSAGWVYRRPSFTVEPCRSVVVKPRVIKYVCSRRVFPTPDLAPPFAGDLGVVLDVGGEQYCASFGGVTVENSSARLRRRIAAAPVACPAPGCGGFVTQFGSGGSNPGEFLFPLGIAVGAAGDIYVVDSLNHRVQRFTAAGVFVAAWGGFGSGDGQFRAPAGIARDASGNLYVADVNNHRIQKFDATGAFLAKWGAQGSGDGEFEMPFFTAVDANGDVYVADVNNHRIQKFDATGAFLAKWGVPGSGDGEFSYPYGIAVDGSLTVYVADSGNARIQAFTSGGVYLAQWGSQGLGPGQLSTPAGLAVDGAGDLYVTEAGNSRVQKFTSGGTHLGRWGSPGIRPGQFSEGLRGLAIDATGDILVVDPGNHRVQKFSCP